MEPVSDAGQGAGVRGYVVTLGAVLVSLAAAAVLQPFVGLENVDLVLLTAVVAVAATLRARPFSRGRTRERAGLQLLLHPPDLHLRGRRSEERHGSRSSSPCRSHHRKSRGESAN